MPTCSLLLRWTNQWQLERMCICMCVCAERVSIVHFWNDMEFVNIVRLVFDRWRCPNELYSMEGTVELAALDGNLMNQRLALFKLFKNSRLAYQWWATKRHTCFVLGRSYTWLLVDHRQQKNWIVTISTSNLSKSMIHVVKSKRRSVNGVPSISSDICSLAHHVRPTNDDIYYICS